MKKLIKLLTFGTLCLGMPLFNACSFLRSNDNQAVGIADITAEPDDDGNIVITITYTDEDKEPVSFILPKGTDGEKGVGIKSIDYDQDEAGYTTVTIKFTNNKMEDVVFTLAPGKSITGVYPVIDDDGNTILYFVDSDGNRIEPDPPIVIYKGDTGVGIASVTSMSNPDHSTTVIVTLDDGTTHPFDIPPAIGVAGVSIDVNEEGNYVLTFTYTDDTSSTVSFTAPPTWTTGSAKPSDSFGKNGDYFFDTEHDVIYIKQNGGWVEAVNFNTDAVTYSITFKLNDTVAEPAEFVLGESFYSGIKRGETFYASGRDVPYPHRSNYTFVGWSTVSSNPKPTNGYFTDLTPVFSDMTLYAIWSQN